MSLEKREDIHYAIEGKGETLVLWGHGWGMDRRAFEPWARNIKRNVSNIVVDFPGFGQSPIPAEIWGTEDYADAMAAFIKTNFIKAKTDRKIIWVGHSFGGRVGIRLAARHPDLVAGLFLVASAGLKRKRPLWKTLYFKTRIMLYKTLKKLIPFGLPEEWLMRKFGSADYKNAGPMRKILVRTVNEDLAAQAAQIRCPVTLLYGAQDTETPPEIGRRLASLIPGANIIVLEGFDHYTILTSGMHQALAHLDRFIRTLSGHQPHHD